jgi:hypothetical protein
MTRKSVGFWLAAVGCCGPVSCGLTSHHRIDAPPPDPERAAAWWARTADRLPADVRAAYVAAADAHLARGTSATYVETRYFTTMSSKSTEELRLPCPPPPDALARLRRRVQPGDLDRGSGTLERMTVQECVGCSPELAESLWRWAASRARSENGGP